MFREMIEWPNSRGFGRLMWTDVCGGHPVESSDRCALRLPAKSDKVATFVTLTDVCGEISAVAKLRLETKIADLPQPIASPFGKDAYNIRQMSPSVEAFAVNVESTDSTRLRIGARKSGKFSFRIQAMANVVPEFG